jgi:hypothetical protein
MLTSNIPRKQQAMPLSRLVSLPTAYDMRRPQLHWQKTLISSFLNHGTGSAGFSNLYLVQSGLHDSLYPGARFPAELIGDMPYYGENVTA